VHNGARISRAAKRRRPDALGATRSLEIVPLLKNYAAQRVQKSVFEAVLDERELQGLIRRLQPVVEEKEDPLRVHHLCAACVKKVEVYGRGEVTREAVSYMA